MQTSQELRILILHLVAKHPTLKDDYSLTRYFAKSSILPNELNLAKQELVNDGFISIEEVKNTVRYYKTSDKGLEQLKKYDLINYLQAFALKIDNSGFIFEIICRLENQ
jgi:hypothetical protein